MLSVLIFFSKSEEKWPEIKFPNIVNYLAKSITKVFSRITSSFLAGLDTYSLEKQLQIFPF